MNDADDWLNQGQGPRPRLRWSFLTDAPLIDLRLARETGDLLIADASGGLYRVDRRGKVSSLVRLKKPVRLLAWSETASAAVGVTGQETLVWFNPRLGFDWTRELPDAALGLAMDPYGHHAAISLANGRTIIFSSSQRKVSEFETPRPLKTLCFLTESAELVGAAEYGFIGRYNLRGEPVWAESLWSTVGDLAITGDGSGLFLAGFAHGVQVFDGATGNAKGAFVFDGTVSLVSSTYKRQRLYAATLEKHLVCLQPTGELSWMVPAPDDLVRLQALPLGDGVICGFSTGRVLRLDH